MHADLGKPGEPLDHLQLVSDRLPLLSILDWQGTAKMSVRGHFHAHESVETSTEQISNTLKHCLNRNRLLRSRLLAGNDYIPTHGLGPARRNRKEKSHDIPEISWSISRTGGLVFVLLSAGTRNTAASAQTLTTLSSFNEGNGAGPAFGSLILNARGNLIGTTQYGGASGVGTVFEIAKTSGGYASTPTTLVTFNNTNGAFPEAGLIADAKGDLFGTTEAGGAYGDGTVFEIANRCVAADEADNVPGPGRPGGPQKIIQSISLGGMQAHQPPSSASTIRTARFR